MCNEGELHRRTLQNSQTLIEKWPVPDTGHWSSCMDRCSFEKLISSVEKNYS